MKNFFLLLFIGLFYCNNDSVASKDYSRNHLEALQFIQANGMQSQFYYLLDYSIHSGKYRFFIYDFTTKKIVESALVTHGSCDQFETNATKWEKAKFSNRNSSHCSSIGKYKIGKRAYSSWGINVKYWLHGLEETNKNAEQRVVVLHSWSAVKDKEVAPKYSPLSWGCPAVSDVFMGKLDLQLQQSNLPVLLWIIE